jgi:hypothetical protein
MVAGEDEEAAAVVVVVAPTLAPMVEDSREESLHRHLPEDTIPMTITTIAAS